jgi:hypothetical protein
MISAAELAQAVSAYTNRFRGEALALSPLWQTLTHHVRAGTCLHRGSCPLVKVQPVIVDENHRVLMLQYHGGRPVLPEAGLLAGSEGLAAVAADAARLLGVDPWVEPGCEHPFHMEVGRAGPEDGERSRVSIRYLLRTHSEIGRWVKGAPQVWTPLGEIEQDLGRRIRAFLGTAVR